MINNQFSNSSQAFDILYPYILENGDIENGTTVLRNISFTVSNPMKRDIKSKIRKWSSGYAEKEWAWYMSGDKNATEIAKSGSIWNNMMDENGDVNSNYGFHWAKNNQLNKVIQLLKENKNTRRAVVMHYDYNELDNYTKDTPCNVGLNFSIYNNRLHLTVFARSIDLVYGFLNDQYQFSKLQEMVSLALDIKPGTSHYFITNLHIYERHYNLIK